MKIDVCMVSVVRPSMIRETTKLLIKNYLNDDHAFRLILNVDPIGERGKTQEDVVNIIKDFDFFDDIVVRTPPKPHVVKAVRWCLDQAETDLVIFKEDDIAILEPLDLNRMIALLEGYLNLSSLHTDKWGTALDHKRTLDENAHKILRCNFLNLREKVDFVFIGCSFLNVTLVTLLALAGLLTAVFPSVYIPLPIVQISLVFLLICIPAGVSSSIVALYLEGAEKDYHKIGYAWLLNLVATPVIAFAALKGLFSRKGYFHRTHKTGRIIK